MTITDTVYVKILSRFTTLLNLWLLVVVTFFTTGCFLDSKISRFDQSASTSQQKKINLSAQTTTLSLVEGSSFTIDLNLDSALAEDTTLSLILSGGSSGTSRFSLNPTSAIFTAGTSSKTVTYTTIDDSVYQGNETFTVTISSTDNILTLSNSSVSFTVLDNDAAALPTVTVAKVYPINGAKWLSFIKGNNGGVGIFNQPDTACVGTETGSTEACIHGGDKLKVAFPSYTSCTGLTITDFLGAFEWLCTAQGGAVIFYSTGLKLGKGLSDLINFASNDWLENNVTVSYNAVPIAASTSAKWWSKFTENPITAAPTSTTAHQMLSGYPAGTILTISADVDSFGFNINQDSLGLVVKNGSTVTFANSAGNCDENTGEYFSAGYRILVCTGNQKYLWIEGAFRGTGGNTDEIVALAETKFSRVNKIRIAESGVDVGLLLISSNMNTYSDIEIKNGTGFGFFWIENSNYNRILKFKAAHQSSSTTMSALQVEFDSNYNIFNDISISNWDARAILLNGNNNILSNMFVSNAGQINILGQNHVVSHVTSVNNASGLVVSSAGGLVVNQFLSASNINDIFLDGVTYSTLSQIAIKRWVNYAVGFSLDNSSNTKFTNNILIDDASSTYRCMIANSGGNDGTNATTCGNQGTLSNANWVYFSEATVSPLIGSISSDNVNAHGSSSSMAYASITDWLNFANPFRMWSSSAGNECKSGTCVLADFRIRTADALIKNKSGNGLTANGTFVAGAPCPSAVTGQYYLTDSQPSPHAFLANATEVMSDAIGNDNSLCESGEACIYSPNFGAYQGEGTYQTGGTCTFQNGFVTDVIMYAYPTNGG